MLRYPHKSCGASIRCYHTYIRVVSCDLKPVSHWFFRVYISTSPMLLPTDGRVKKLLLWPWGEEYLHVFQFVPNYLDYNSVQPAVQSNYNLEDLSLTLIQTDYSSRTLIQKIFFQNFKNLIFIRLFNNRRNMIMHENLKNIFFN